MAPPAEAAHWSTEQLASFLTAMALHDDAERAVECALAAVAQAVGAAFVAMVTGEEVTAVHGAEGAAVPAESVVAAAAGGLPSLLPGLGSCELLVVPVVGVEGTALVAARRGGAFEAEELVLVRGMAGILGLTLRMLRSVEADRRLRARGEAQAAENEHLVVILQERQQLLERLFEIQRSISHRAPIESVFDAITKGAGLLLGDGVVALRLIDTDDPGYLRLVACVGVKPEIVEAIRRTPVGQGVGGRAVAQGELVIADLYEATSRRFHHFIQDGLHTAMAAPVHADGKVVGSLLVASYRADRRYSDAEQHVLLSFAEHVSLALNDANAIGAIRQSYAVVLHQATHDPLTELANRALVLDRIRAALAEAEATGEDLSVLFVDLDGFKRINDSLGHSVGDEVLIRIAERLQGAVRADDVVARIGGDEFVVLCEGLSDAGTNAIAARMSRAVSEPLPVYGHSVVLTASIGIARARTAVQAEDLLRDADVAMYRAKGLGPGRIESFDESIRVDMLDRLVLEQSLHRALGRDELRLHYQPVVELSTGRCVGAEALIRWEHPQRGLVMPDAFIQVAEDAGLIVPFGAWVLDEACRQRAAWGRDRRCDDSFRLSVNLSARQFADADLVGTIEGALERAGLTGSALCLEITESVLMDDARLTVGTLADLRALGLRLSVDDFGTGYSSLSYLKRFALDEVKIDQSFVEGLGRDPDDEVLVRAIVSLADALHLEAVAEGVETEQQLETLRSLGCDRVQGFLLGHPAPVHPFAAGARSGR